ncbi:unnamed protein product [Hymenolepis diminuta]|uniref:Requiem_N domain-containing protein n=1 Tax=Hymenolepis diminuta TaxID=6216 RepID=A0A158QG12_HYMDI|nr:unnamed protein product [Hymenolepis diminuta]
MATVSTVPNDFVPTAASNVNASAGLRYDSILADACAFNRRLRKGRVNRLDFFDSATQIAQRPAPWLHRSVQARTKNISISVRQSTSADQYLTKTDGAPVMRVGFFCPIDARYREETKKLYRETRTIKTHHCQGHSNDEGDGGGNGGNGLSLTRSHFLVTYRRHRWRIQPGFKRKFAESLEHSRLLYMFQTISFPGSNVGIDTSNARGSLTRPQTTSTEFSKLSQPSQTTLGISSTDPEASLPGSVSNEGSCQSSATPNSVNNSTTASNGGGDRRISTVEMQQQPQQQSSKQPQSSPSIEDYAGQRYDSYARKYVDDDDPEHSKLKFRRRIMGISADKTGVIRRYHRRIGGGVVGRPRGRRGIPGRIEVGCRWAQMESSGNSLQGFEVAYDEDSQDAYSPPDEAIYRSNANLSSGGLNDGLTPKLPHSAFSDGSDLLETTVVPRPETPSHTLHHHQHSLHGQTPSQTQAPMSSSQSSANATPTSSTSMMMMSHYHHHSQQQQSGLMDKRMSQEFMHDPATLEWRNNPMQPDMSGPPPPPRALPPGRPQMAGQQPPSYHQHHPSSLPTSPHHQQHGPPSSMQSNVPSQSQSQSQGPQPLPPPQQSSSNSAADTSSNHGGGPMGSQTPGGTGSGSSSEPTTVVTFFVCEVCASRYRSTADNYPSFRTGATNNKGRGLSAANQQIVNQRGGSQMPGEGGESDPYHMPSANTPEEPHPRSVYSSSSEPQQTESSLSSVNSSSYISPIKLKSTDLDYSARGKAFSGYVPPLPPPSTSHQPPPPPYDQHSSYYGAPSALASMDHMASSLLRQQHNQQQQQQSQQSQPLHSLLAQLHPTSYKPYGDTSSLNYYGYQQRPYSKPSFVELKGMLRQRRSQYPADAFTCGYCQMHVESGALDVECRCIISAFYAIEEREVVRRPEPLTVSVSAIRGSVQSANRVGFVEMERMKMIYPYTHAEVSGRMLQMSQFLQFDQDKELIICCCECDRGYHGYCLTGSSPSYQATSFPDDWVCEICRQQDACLAPQQPSTIH